MTPQSNAESYPLETTTEADLRALSQVLWCWHECPAAQGSSPACGAACPWPRHARLAQFHALYKQLAASYVPDMDYGRPPALRHHSDLFDIIKSLKEQPDVSRTQLMSQYFSTRRQAAKDDSEREMPTPEDQERAFSLAARVMTTVACSGEDAASAVLELGTEPVPWRGETSISQFLLAAFPLANTLSLDSLPGARRNQDVRLFLSAETITKVGRLRLQPTDDIRSHLNLDSKAGAVQIYQQTAVLKEHLKATEQLAATATIAETIQVNIPRQLALEVLASLNSILFPPMTKSHGILRALVSKGVFDKDMLQLESRDVRHRHEVEGEYRYLASKLRDLYDEVDNPTPRGRFERWFDRRIAQRYFMMATFGGLVVAIILGILGLAVGIFQAWVAYQAWRFPVGGS